MGKPLPKCSKRLTPDQQKVFINNGFTNTLLHAVIKKGWDKKDIDNFIYVYNHNTRSQVKIPVLMVGMTQEIARMKRASARGGQQWQYQRHRSWWNFPWFAEEYPCRIRRSKAATLLQARYRSPQRDPEVPKVN